MATPSLRAIGNVCSGSGRCMRAIADAGGVPAIVACMNQSTFQVRIWSHFLVWSEKQGVQWGRVREGQHQPPLYSFGFLCSSVAAWPCPSDLYIDKY